jgi:hypothetical protein
MLAPTYSVLTDAADYPGLNNLASNPTVVSQFCNGARTPPEFASGGYQVPPGISDATIPNPVFSLSPAATVDEGNNWINIGWGPLALTSPVTGTVLGNYALAVNSPAIDFIPTSASTYSVTPSTDFFGNPRPDPAVPNRFDVGAVESQGKDTIAALAVTGGPLAFGSVPTGSTSAAKTLSLQNYGGAPATTITVVVTAPFARPAGTAGGTCGTTLAAGSTCTINIVFSPTASVASTGTATITANVAVSGSPVSLTGTGITPVASASLAPTSRNFGTHARTCSGTTPAQILACSLEPTQVFTLTNTGNLTVTGIGHGTLGGTNPTEFGIVNLLSTCGAAGGGQLMGQHNPGAWSKLRRYSAVQAADWPGHRRESRNRLGHRFGRHSNLNRDWYSEPVIPVSQLERNAARGFGPGQHRRSDAIEVT